MITRVKKEEGAAWAAGEDGEPLKLHAVAHCMGAAVLAEALLRRVEGVAGRLSRVVLTTMGLFYQINLHGRLKAEAQLLQQLSGKGGLFPVIDPRPRELERIDPELFNDLKHNGRVVYDKTQTKDEDNADRFGHELIDELYRNWRVPYDLDRIDREDIPEHDRPVFEMFNRLSFMYGEPYQETNLAPEIHHRIAKVLLNPHGDLSYPLPKGTRVQTMEGYGNVARGELVQNYDGQQDEPLMISRFHGDFRVRQKLAADGQSIGDVRKVLEPEPALLPNLFGAMPVPLFQHAADNALAGVATEAGNSSGRLPRSWLETIAEDPGPAGPYEGFDALERLTLIGGGLNRLWHRDSIDRMADWLLRNPERPSNWSKVMLRDFGHQDLLWGETSKTDVFPKIRDGLAPRENWARPADDEGPAVMMSV